MFIIQTNCLNVQITGKQCLGTNITDTLCLVHCTCVYPFLSAVYRLICVYDKCVLHTHCAFIYSTRTSTGGICMVVNQHMLPHFRMYNQSFCLSCRQTINNLKFTVSLTSSFIKHVFNSNNTLWCCQVAESLASRACQTVAQATREPWLSKRTINVDRQESLKHRSSEFRSVVLSQSSP